MRLLILTVALAALCAGCAGLTVNTQHNEMFNPDGDKGVVHPVVNFGPPANALAGLDSDAIKDVLLAYADAASEWMTFAPSWTQSVGSDIASEGQVDARIRAALAKEITGDTGTGDSENVPLDGP